MIDAACWRNFNGRCVGLFVLSPAGGTVPAGQPSGSQTAPAQTIVTKEATGMPAALVESLFISNADDAALLRTEAAREALAQGLARGILRYLGLPA